MTNTINSTDAVPNPKEKAMTGNKTNVTKCKSENGLSAAEQKRRLRLYKATSKNLFEGITDETGLPERDGETYKQQRARQFTLACEVLNVEIATLKNIQKVFLRGPKKGYLFSPTIALDREYSLTMLMRAFADYQRFKPRDWASM
jgi:hypothetical protein